MLQQLLNALDERVGHRKLLKLALEERIPGGASWAFVLGSAALVLFAVQLLTGLVLAILAFKCGREPVFAVLVAYFLVSGAAFLLAPAFRGVPSAAPTAEQQLRVTEMRQEMAALQEKYADVIAEPVATRVASLSVPATTGVHLAQVLLVIVTGLLWKGQRRGAMASDVSAEPTDAPKPHSAARHGAG